MGSYGIYTEWKWRSVTIVGISNSAAPGLDKGEPFCDDNPITFASVKCIKSVIICDSPNEIMSTNDHDCTIERTSGGGSESLSLSLPIPSMLICEHVNRATLLEFLFRTWALLTGKRPPWLYYPAGAVMYQVSFLQRNCTLPFLLLIRNTRSKGREQIISCV